MRYVKRPLATLLTALASTLLCLGAAPTVAAPADRFADVTIQTVPVRGSIHMLVGAGGNIGVSLGDDGLVMIDSQYAPLSDRIKVALAALATDKPTWLLNTHHHGDHVGGNSNFPGSTILAHYNVRQRMKASGLDAGLPDMTYRLETQLHVNGDTIKVIHMPSGHTDGDSVVQFVNANVIHMGDHFFKDQFPYVDINAGGTVGGLIHNISRVLRMIDDDTRVIPGHGALATRADLERYQRMLQGTTRVVADQLAEGADPEDILQRGLPDYRDWARGFITEERWVQTLLTDFARRE